MTSLTVIFTISFARISLNIIANVCKGEPLLLTPYLKAGKIKEAQEKALVVPDMAGVRSYTGFFTVNKKCDNNLFFWFVPAENNWEKAPVLLWLNGGPGASSLLGMFTEVGPFDHTKKEGFVKKKHHWTKDNNIIFLDQPVGTGYSFSEKKCYCKDLLMSCQDVYEALVQFFTMFPNLSKNRFFITGESFGGHSIPAIAYEIHKQNTKVSYKINMIGIVVGNPYIDVRCHYVGSFLYELGIIDEKTHDSVVKYETTITRQLNEKNYTAAIATEREMYAGPLDEPKIPSTYNIAYDVDYQSQYQLFIRSYEVRKQIHVGDAEYHVLSDPVYQHLEEELYMPSTWYIEELLKSNKYIVGFYSGQLDVVCLYTSLPCVLRQLKWDGATDYLAANRTQWYVDDRLAGWFKVAGNLFEVVIRASGHFVPTDQPRAALELITAAVSDTPGSKLLSKLQTKPSS